MRDLYGEMLGNILSRQAPQGESLAFINDREADVLKSMGGSGVRTPSGIPSYQEFSPEVFADFGYNDTNISDAFSEIDMQDPTIDLNSQFAPAALAPIDSVRGQEILNAIADAEDKEKTILGRLMPGRYQGQYNPYLNAPPEPNPINVIKGNDILSGVLGLATNPIIGATVGEYLRSKETNPYFNTGTRLANMGGSGMGPTQSAQDMADARSIAQISLDDDPLLRQRSDILTDILLLNDDDNVTSQSNIGNNDGQYFTPSEAIQKRIRDNLAFGQSAV